MADRGGCQMARFEKFASHAKVEFWSTLEKKKIHELRLSDDAVPIRGVFAASKSAGDPGKVELDGHSFYQNANAGLFEYVIPGTLHNFNTVEEYQALDTKAAVRAHAEELWQNIVSGAWADDVSLLYRFHVYSFANLKSHVFHSRTVLPILSPQEPIQVSGQLRKITQELEPEEVKDFSERWDAARGVGAASAGPLAHVPVFILDKRTRELLPINALRTTPNAKSVLEGGSLVVAVVDCCGSPHFGWATRNLLIALRAAFTANQVTVISLRESVSAGVSLSLVADFVIPAALLESGSLPASLPASITPFGWETAKPAVNLAKSMDPTLLAEESAKLNLSLMKWRMVPNLDLEKIAAQKCLVVGSGTLGCGVARNLMKWGIFEFTMIDRGNVSFSNTVRQSLFIHDDAVQGKNKAQAAADACRRIYPLCKVAHADINVPMPGHAISSEAQRKEVRETVERFEALVAAHDVIFLLTDSRESRWLPTLLGTKHNKIVLNAALGFDSYVMMRHGAPTDPDRLACYFCSDITSPADSLSDRSLDQQCTVTRPGVSDIASAGVVELLASIISHPDGIHAAAPGSKGGSFAAASSEGKAGVGCLGDVPHQVRGGLYHFDQMCIYGKHFPNCVGCSSSILQAYNQHGFEFIEKVLNDPSTLTETAGIDAMLKVADDLDDMAAMSDEEED